MFRACYNGRLPMVKFLLEHGASLGRGADEWENTPLHACAINGHKDVSVCVGACMCVGVWVCVCVCVCTCVHVSPPDIDASCTVV
jgi:hypothetical protein